MHIIEQRILNNFKKEPGREIPTTEIVRAVYPEEYAKIIRGMSDELSDKRLIQQARRKKGQLHRKILYHLGNLVKDDILKVTSIKGKGEKYFSLSIEEGELIIEKKHKKIVISKPSISTTLIEEYEDKGIVHKFDPDNWINKVNCILLESTKHTGLNSFYNLIYTCFSEVNDVLGLNNFEHLIQKSSQENVEEILKKLDIDTKDHERFVSLIINVKNIDDDKKVSDFIKSFAKINPKNVTLVFKTESKELRAHKTLFKTLISELSEAEIKINIHNRKVHNAPIIIGKAGPYTLLEEEWKEYEENIRGKTMGLVIANTTIAIDVNRFFSQTRDNQEFRSLIQRTAKTLLKVNTTQKKKANEYFKRLDELNKPYTKKFFAYAKNYIRFWNYDWREKQHEHILELLESTIQEIKKFCTTQQTIYRACGIPFNFNIVFSSVFRKYIQNLSTRRYIKTTIRKFKDYHTPEIIKFIETREKLFKIFEGGDRIRFFRSEEFVPEEVIREFTFLINTYELPLITYDFRERRGETKLTSFME
ncbi:hypothetical protein AYK26_04580 [Euryarchaeota archaeon SM23-78]|nr:MAG: hypothetical protein AYK26_04580 [Euryarchaeota archaeon SM23-78]